LITAAQIKARFPALAGMDSGFLDLCIAEAVLEMNASAWGSLYDLGLLNLSAHKAITTSSESDGIGSAGAVTSKTVGSVSVSFAASGAAASSPCLASTSYGQEFSRLQRRVFGGAVAAENS
jgi:hypothetical protein